MAKTTARQLHWLVKSQFHFLKIETSKTLSTFLAVGGHHGRRRPPRWVQSVTALSKQSIVEGTQHSATTIVPWLNPLWNDTPWFQAWLTAIALYGSSAAASYYAWPMLYGWYLRRLTRGLQSSEKPNKDSCWPPDAPVYIQVGVKAGTQNYRFLEVDITGTIDTSGDGDAPLLYRKIYKAYQEIQGPAQSGREVT